MYKVPRNGQEKALGVVTDGGSRATFCTKTDTLASMVQGCAEREGIGAGFCLLVGRLLDSCATINLAGDSYIGCECHNDICNTASTITQSNANRFFITVLLLTIINILLP